MNKRRRVSDEELSDLIDGRLDSESEAAIGRALESDPALARRHATLLEQSRLLSRIGEEILNEPIPDRLRAVLASDRAVGGNGDRSRRTTTRIGSARRLQGALLAAGMAAGIAAGWFGHATLHPDNGGLFQKTVERAAISHRLFEVGADDAIADLGDEDVLPVTALPDLFQTPVRAPALRGSRWKPVGLRTETGSDGSAIQVAYADADGEKVTLYVRRVDEVDDLPGNLVEVEGYEVLYWLDGPMLYALVGDVDEAELTRLARGVYASRAIGGHWSDDTVPAAADGPAAD